MGTLDTTLIGEGMWGISAQAIAAAIANAGSATSALAALSVKSNVTVIPLGDSVTQGNSSYDATSQTWHLANNMYAEQACFRAGGRYSVLANAGVTGETSTQIRARLFTDVIDKKPDLCMLCAGTNDIVTGMTTLQKQTLFNNLEYMIQQLLGAGIAVILVTPPAKSSTATGAVETRSCIPFYYALANYYSVPLVDAHKLTTDPATGDYISGYSADGVHPQGAGVVAIATEVAKALNDLTSYSAGLYFPAFVDSTLGNLDYNLLQNGNMESNIGTAGWPDYISNDKTNATSSLANPAPLPTMGKNWQYTKTVAGGALAINRPVPAANFTAGDILRFSGRVKVTGLGASPSGFSIFAQWADDSNFNAPINNMQMDGEYIFSQDFPAHAADLTVQAYIQDAAAYEFSGFVLLNLSAMGRLWTPGTKQA